uniref:Uncharacterized protein n=1 Tax=Anguilla anguilla TaxID=7936 RepID=A0A0E9WEA3_ANGAN
MSLSPPAALLLCISPVSMSQAEDSVADILPNHSPARDPEEVRPVPKSIRGYSASVSGIFCQTDKQTESKYSDVLQRLWSPI